MWLLALLLFLPLPLFLTTDLFSGSEYRALGGSLKAEDFAIFYNAGKLAAAGEPQSAYDFGRLLTSISAQIGERAPDPSTLPQFAPSWPVYLYSPPVTVVFIALASLPFWSALAVWLTIGFASIVLAMWLLWRALPLTITASHQARSPQQYRPSFTIPFAQLALIALGFVPVLIAATNGQNSGLVLLAYAGAFYFSRPHYAGRLDWVAGLFAAVLALWKPQMLIGLAPVWLLTSRWAALAWTAAWVALANALTLLVLPPATYATWAGNLLSFNSGATTGGLPPSDVTVRSLLRAVVPGAGGASDVLYYAYLLGALVLLVVAILTVRRSTLPAEQKHEWLFVLAVMASVLMPPYLLIHDLTLLLLPMLINIVLLSRHGAVMRSRAILAAALVYLGLAVSNLIALLWGVQLAGVVSVLYATFCLYWLFWKDSSLLRRRAPGTI